MAAEADVGESAVGAYAEYELEVLHHANTLADAKASFVLGIALVFAAGAFQPTVRAFQLHEALRAWTGAVGEIALAASGLAAYLTAVPRVLKTSQSPIYWASAVFRQPAADYVHHIAGLPRDQLEAATLAHLHLLAGICRTKYERLKVAFYAAPLGLALLAASYLAGPTY